MRLERQLQPAVTIAHSDPAVSRRRLPVVVRPPVVASTLPPSKRQASAAPVDPVAASFAASTQAENGVDDPTVMMAAQMKAVQAQGQALQGMIDNLPGKNDALSWV